ncbi:Sodium-dependent phosphate transport protein 2A [Holothuria leucospilota]|uniref:Sodium-dependent phosphate transport protein 2A n=1 Tax=Holothuria leucospilota TaxID=206669 RepID=A0A9Q1H6D9_HOLLE|nr:Sodium-dependent phosphate transport protein 2A [Holothuria leucospilota]
MALLYFFICSLDLMCSGFYRMGGREAREVLWDKLLDNRICGLLFLILARAGAVLHAGLLLIEQAVLLGASIRASVTAAVVLLVQVCAIPLSFFMRQGRKYQKGGLFQMCVFVLQFCLSDCQGKSHAKLAVLVLFHLNVITFKLVF